MQFLFSKLHLLPLPQRQTLLDILADDPSLLPEIEERLQKKIQALQQNDLPATHAIILDEQKKFELLLNQLAIEIARESLT